MWYWAFRLIFSVLLKVLFRFKVEGLDNLPEKTNFIVVANHASIIDSVAIGVAIPKKIYWIAARWLYRVPWLAWFLQKTETQPIGGISERAVESLENNNNVGLFPEGKCSLSGKLGEFKRGAAMLAFRTGRPVVPCAVIGSFEALPWRKKIPRFFTKIKVKIGKPIYQLKEFDETIDDMYLQEGTSQIQDAIKELLYAG